MNLPNSRTQAAFMFVCLVAIAAQARGENEPTAIYVMNVDGSKVRMLAQVDGFNEHASPRWSPDATRVAFDAMPAINVNRKLFVVNADGTQLKEVGEGSLPSWSPDGKQLAAHLWPGQGVAKLIVLNADGGGQVEIGLGRGPRWSPDGSKLSASDGTNAFVVDLVTSVSTPVFDQPQFEVFRGCEWSRDGKELAITVRPAKGEKRQLLFVSAEGAAKGQRKRLASELGSFVSYSPDGKQIVYASGNQIYIADVAGNGAPRKVAHQKGKNRNPDWSPDGKSIVFVSDRDKK